MIELAGAESIRATYHASPLRGASDPALARAFVAALLEAPAQAIFAGLGFAPP
ncbi:MAG: hypothetical protein H6711_29650 [Myxococcales bacterium]|nr:hypothetical protein [Myxococcales bacterium]